jgi:putrescine transport system substrate-binding protein
MNKGGLALLILLALVAAALAPVAYGQEKIVNVYNWTDYIGKSSLADFTKATGIKTNYDTFTDLETLEAKLLAGRSGYDVVVPSAEPTLRKLIKAKAVRPLDKAKLPNFKNLDPVLMQRLETLDPGNQYGAIYQWGTIGIGINPDKVKAVLPNAPIDSWKLLFDPANAKALAKCGIVFLDSATDVLPSVFFALGFENNSEKADELKKVEQAMIAIRPYIKTFVPSVIDPLATGDACVAFGYSGDVLQAANRAKEAGGKVKVDYVIPKEGAALWFDTLAIPADAPHLDAAHAFVNFMLDPKAIAGVTNEVQYPNAVPASTPLLDEAIRKDPRIYPTPELMARMWVIGQVSQKADRDRSRAWTRIKTGT